MDEQCDTSPRFRATIAEGVLTLASWHPMLVAPTIGGGIVLRERAAAGVAIADLTVLGEAPERELTVNFVTDPTRSRDAQLLLADWASVCGYTRIWFDEPSVIDLRGRTEPSSCASTRCPTCAASWEETLPHFWLNVRSAGLFPTQCPVCAGTLPQWNARPARRPAPEISATTASSQPATPPEPADSARPLPTSTLGPQTGSGAEDR